jgi:hypothetical protein
VRLVAAENVGRDRDFYGPTTVVKEEIDGGDRACRWVLGADQVAETGDGPGADGDRGGDLFDTTVMFRRMANAVLFTLAYSMTTTVEVLGGSVADRFCRSGSHAALCTGAVAVYGLEDDWKPPSRPSDVVLGYPSRSSRPWTRSSWRKARTARTNSPAPRRSFAATIWS